jgi:hypothetical protein
MKSKDLSFLSTAFSTRVDNMVLLRNSKYPYFIDQIILLRMHFNDVLIYKFHKFQTSLEPDTRK